MRRFVTLAILLLVSVPFGISISGCGPKRVRGTFCEGESGAVVGQITAVNLLPRIYGISVGQGQITSVNSPSATDCKGTSVPIRKVIYSTTDMTLADVDPNTGRLCAGTFNRNTGGGVPDYTTCMSTGKSGTAYITANGDGTASNPLPVFVHELITSILLGNPTKNCSTDPTTDCCPLSTNAAIKAPAYDGSSCLSQGTSGQLVARVFSGTGPSLKNITCQAGHLAYQAENASVVGIDENGVATANKPGSTIISAISSNASSSTGFFATCPPASISLSVAGAKNGNVTLNPNNSASIVAVVKDTKGKPLTGLNLEFVSTTPKTIPVNSDGVITPQFPGTASITAICQPPTCNPAPFNQIGLYGTGKPVSSNPVQVTTPGSNSTFLYVGSTQSQYIVPIDFLTGQQGAPVRLPYVPNSMVISQDGTTIYLGSSTELMVYNAISNSLSREDITVPGTVLAVSPDGTTIVISDPVRKLIYLEASAGGVTTQYGGVGLQAQYSPDGQTVYVAGGNQLLVYSRFTGWNNIVPATDAGTPVTDVAVTVPNVGAYFAGPVTTARSYCPSSTISTANGQATVVNQFNPTADIVATPTDRIAATGDGLHILGANSSALLSDLRVTIPIGPCPTTGGFQFGPTAFSTTQLANISPTAITGVDPTSDSTVAFVTYTGTGGVLPAYAPVASPSGTATQGTLTNIKLSGTATAPVAGVVSSDNTTFFVGTSGDNLVHRIARGAAGYSDTGMPIDPKLPAASGGAAVPNLLVQRPRSAS